MSQMPFFPFETYKNMYEKQEAFYNTWASLLPIHVCVIKTPKLLKTITGAEDLPYFFVSHDLLILYRCFLYYVPQMYINIQYKDKTVQEFLEKEKKFSFCKQFQIINAILQEEHKLMYKKQQANANKISGNANFLQFLNSFEKAILKSIYLYRIAFVESTKLADDMVTSLPAIMQMSDETMRKLKFDLEITHKMTKVADVAASVAVAQNEYKEHLNSWKNVQKQVQSEISTKT